MFQFVGGGGSNVVNRLGRLQKVQDSSAGIRAWELLWTTLHLELTRKSLNGATYERNLIRCS